MIEPVLNRDFVLQNAHATLSALRAQPEDRRAVVHPIDRLSPEERGAAAQALSDALTREQTTGSFHGHFERPAAERHGEAPLVDWAFISHDPVLSIVQSALEKHLSGLPAAVATKGAAAARNEEDDDRPGKGSASAGVPVTSTILRGMFAQPEGDRRAFGAFEETDPRWVGCWVAEGLRWLHGRVPFPTDPAPPRDIAPNARVVLISDWASGLPRARALARNVMKKWINEAPERECHVVHLGDIYYSGWEEECQTRFLDPWPVEKAQSGRITSWALNGNHDMYCGGRGYFDTVLKDPRFLRQDKSSRFTLRHPKWEILGLDTAYVDDSLSYGQAADVAAQLATARRQGRKGMLLSHHQLFSAYESGSKNMGDELRSPLAAGLIRSWFWGHEHRCAIYRPTQGVEFARCIGHGGVPVYQWRSADDPKVEPPALFEYRGAFTTTVGAERWAVFGFAVLDFKADGTVHEYHVDANGDTYYGAQRDAQGRRFGIID